MNPDTGEIKETKDGFVPVGWIGLPKPGDQVEVVCPPDKKRGRVWVVVDVLEGTPGKLVLEPTIETVNKCARG